MASWFLPRRLRDPVAAIYAFARTADDMADEGDLSPAQRLRSLAELDQRLSSAVAGGDVDDPVCLALADACRRHGLPPALLGQLLSAFRQDVVQGRYRDDAELLDYCRRSANPIGRLLLHLAGQTDAARLAASDALCTALQLLNFLQDIAEDYHARDRLYLPQSALRAHSLAPGDLFESQAETRRRVAALMGERIAVVERWLALSRPLETAGRGPLAWQIRLTRRAAHHLCVKLRRRGAELHSRCRLDRRDLALVGVRALVRT